MNDGRQPRFAFAGYLFKFVVGFVGTAIPIFALIAFIFHISPTRLIQPFLLLLTPAIPVGILMYFASVNIQRPKTFSLLLALSTSITLLVFQFSFLHFGSEFCFITGGLRTIWIPVALLVAAVVPTIIFFRCKQRLEAKFGGGSD